MIYMIDELVNWPKDKLFALYEAKVRRK